MGMKVLVILALIIIALSSYFLFTRFQKIKEVDLMQLSFPIETPAREIVERDYMRLLVTNSPVPDYHFRTIVPKGSAYSTTVTISERIPVGDTTIYELAAIHAVDNGSAITQVFIANLAGKEPAPMRDLLVSIYGIGLISTGPSRETAGAEDILFRFQADGEDYIGRATSMILYDDGMFYLIISSSKTAKYEDNATHFFMAISGFERTVTRTKI